MIRPSLHRELGVHAELVVRLELAVLFLDDRAEQHVPPCLEVEDARSLRARGEAFDLAAEVELVLDDGAVLDRKVRRIEADPRVSLTVETAVGEPEAWVTIEGVAAVVPEGGYDLAERLAPRYYEPNKAAEAVAAWKETDWVVIELTPNRIKSGAPES